MVGDKCLGLVKAIKEVFPETKYQRCMLLAFQQAFIPLPPYRYDTSRTQKATVNDFAMVRFDSNQYSVPYRLVGRAVTVKTYGLTVEFISKTKWLPVMTDSLGEVSASTDWNIILSFWNAVPEVCGMRNLYGALFRHSLCNSLRSWITPSKSLPY